MTSEPERPEQRLEQTMQDAYIVSLKRKEECLYAYVSAEEKQKAFETLVQIVEQMQQIYGTGKLCVTRKFEYVPSVAVLIKDKGLVELLQKEGYSVEQQGRMQT